MIGGKDVTLAINAECLEQFLSLEAEATNVQEVLDLQGELDVSYSFSVTLDDGRKIPVSRETAIKIVEGMGFSAFHVGESGNND